MRKIFKCYFISLLILILSTCSTVKSTSVQKDNSIDDIHIIGYEIVSENNPYISLWYNGSEHTISSDFAEVHAADMVIHNNNIYIVGYEGDYYSSRACYWINGVKYYLGSETDNSEATGIYIYENDIYISGVKKTSWHRADDDKSSPGYLSYEYNAILVYWKNGDEYILTQDGKSPQKNSSIDINRDYGLPSSLSQTVDINILNDKVIVFGYNNGLAVYWYNEIEHSIGNVKNISTLVYNKDFYIIGNEYCGNEYVYYQSTSIASLLT
jgi:hypothetical protein